MQVRRRFSAPPERVYRAWTNAEELKLWHCPEDLYVDRAECDPRVGGRFLVNMVDKEGQDNRAVGEYLEMVPGRRLVFTWSWEAGGGGDQNTRVTVEFDPLPEGGTELTLTHELFEDEDSCEGHRSGWSSAFNQLETHLRSK